MDIFNASSGQWSTATLVNEGRYPAATSLPAQGLAIFAGGRTGFVIFVSGLILSRVACVVMGVKGVGSM